MIAHAISAPFPSLVYASGGRKRMPEPSTGPIISALSVITPSFFFDFISMGIPPKAHCTARRIICKIESWNIDLQKF